MQKKKRSIVVLQFTNNMKDIIIKKVNQLLAITKKTMEDIVKATGEDLRVVENPNPSQDEPTEVRYASIEDSKIREEMSKPVDYSKGAKVYNGEELVTTFTIERDGKDYVEQAEAYAAEHGYEVKE